jgi:hypothetical protein
MEQSPSWEVDIRCACEEVQTVIELEILNPCSQEPVSEHYPVSD